MNELRLIFGLLIVPPSNDPFDLVTGNKELFWPSDLYSLLSGGSDFLFCAICMFGVNNKITKFYII